VSDIDRECERLRALGMTFGHHRSPVDAGHVKTLYGKDPEGNVIEIQETAPHCEFGLEKLQRVSR
jgi:hypothetical protein